MKKKILGVLLAFILVCISFTGCVVMYSANEGGQKVENLGESLKENTEENSSTNETSSDYIEEPTQPPIVGSTGGVFDISKVPEYSGTPFAVINGNSPYFTDEKLTEGSYEFYAELDSLGRCGITEACVGQDIMPTEERGEIGSVKPTGWHTVKYDCVDGKYLYNRCHLIGFQLTGENANTKNLITGTRYMNVDGMLPFENMIADYVKETGNHVMYRVTPIYEGNNLVATGVLMEAKSVEDNGDGILFCVFCYNVQPGVDINYATGESTLADEVEENTTESTTGSTTYVLNTNSKKFHSASCSGADDISADNRTEYTGTREEVVAMGYEPCGRCKP